MANPFGGFVHRSPLSSRPHDPQLDLASNCVRDFFGPTVQTVADALVVVGSGSTLPQIVSAVQNHCRRITNEERERLVDRLGKKGADHSNDDGPRSGPDEEGGGAWDDDNDGALRMNKARGPETSGFVVDASPVRAALIVLLQHSIVSASPPPPPSLKSKKARPPRGYRYAFLPDRARLLPRYPRYVAHTKQVLDGPAAAVVEEICAHGRLRAEDCVRFGTEHLRMEAAAAADDDDDDEDEEEGDDGGRKGGGAGTAKIKGEPGVDVDEEVGGVEQKGGDGGGGEKKGFDEDAARSSVADALRRLVEGGYLERVKPLAEPMLATDPDAGEAEFDGGDVTGNPDPGKRMRSASSSDRESGRKRTKVGEGIGVDVDGGYGELNDSDEEGGEEEKEVREADAGPTLEDLAEIDRDESVRGQPPGVEPDPLPVLLALRRVDRRRDRLFPPGCVFRLNARMYHDSLRSAALGRLVAERYGDRVPMCGSYVSAALRLAARREHSPDGGGGGGRELTEEQRSRLAEDRTCFVPDEVLEYMPPGALANLRNRAGGARANLSSALVQLTRFGWPQCVAEVEEARGHARGGKFEVSTRQLVEHLRGRVLHRAVLDAHGEVAARICSILETKGYLESDAVAQAAMVPAKDVREILHRLYRHNIVSLLNLQMSKQHNQSNAIFLWTVRRPRMFRTVVDDVCRALVNLRLRRQHEMELGKDWIERAKEADVGGEEENDHALDRINYERFCQGLERLDNACLQLDETLMVLKDF